PMSAWVSAGASFTPSPVMATTRSGVCFGVVYGGAHDRARCLTRARRWRRDVADVVERPTAAFEPDEVVIGKGNASMLKAAAASASARTRARGDLPERARHR